MRIPGLILLAAVFAISGCGTSDSTMRDEGHNESYIQGFHDGRHSGMREAGNNFEHYVQDRSRFDADSEYRNGWLAGESEGRRLQREASNIGRAAGGAYQDVQIGREIDRQTDSDRIVRDALKDVDTSGLESLEKD